MNENFMKIMEQFKKEYPQADFIKITNNKKSFEKDVFVKWFMENMFKNL